jgi:hypothetical protein
MALLLAAPYDDDDNHNGAVPSAFNGIAQVRNVVVLAAPENFSDYTLSTGFAFD